NEACSVVLRYPWHLVVPGVLAKLAGEARYAARRGWLLQEPRVWGEILWRLPQALRDRRAVRSRGPKIVAVLQRRRCVDSEEAWRLGEISWWKVLFEMSSRAAARVAGAAAGAANQARS